MNFRNYPMDTQFCHLRYFVNFIWSANIKLIFRLLSFGHTLQHNLYTWDGSVETDHVVISDYNLAIGWVST